MESLITYQERGAMELEPGWTKKEIKVALLKPGHIIYPSSDFGVVLEAELKGPIMRVSTVNRPFCGWPAESMIFIEVPSAETDVTRSGITG